MLKTKYLYIFLIASFFNVSNCYAITPADIFAQMGQKNTVTIQDVTVVYDLTGEGGGQFGIVIKNGSINIHQGPFNQADVIIRMKASDFVLFSKNPQKFQEAFMSGKIKVEGDLTAVMQLQQIY